MDNALGALLRKAPSETLKILHPLNVLQGSNGRVKISGRFNQWVLMRSS